jgi:hypothetical protein
VPRQSPLQKGNQVRKPLPKDEILNCIIGKEQEPKYKPGAPMMPEADLEAVGPNCARLHAYVMKYSMDKLAFLAKVGQHYFLGGGALMLNIQSVACITL